MLSAIVEETLGNRNNQPKRLVFDYSGGFPDVLWCLPRPRKILFGTCRTGRQFCFWNSCSDNFRRHSRPSYRGPAGHALNRYLRRSLQKDHASLDFLITRNAFGADHRGAVISAKSGRQFPLNYLAKISFGGKVHCNRTGRSVFLLNSFIPIKLNRFIVHSTRTSFPLTFRTPRRNFNHQ